MRTTEHKEVVHKALIIIQTQFSARLEMLGAAYFYLKNKFEISEVSSVFLVQPKAGRKLTGGGHLVAAFTVLTSSAPGELAVTLLDYEKARPHEVEFFLAAYEDEVLLTPQLTLPHPELHLNPQWLAPASEIWGSYTHPILRKPLQEVYSEADQGDWGQFYAQGKSLDEFSYKPPK